MSELFYMAGTEGTGEYFVVAASSLGRVGCRDLGGRRMRVRVEPSSEEAAAELAVVLQAPQWKQPGDNGQNRFSCMILEDDPDSHYDELFTVLVSAQRALNDGLELTFNPGELPAWWAQMVDSVSNQFENWLKLVESMEQEERSRRPLPVENQGDDNEHASLVARARKLKLPGANGASRWKLETLRAKLAEFEQA